LRGKFPIRIEKVVEDDRYLSVVRRMQSCTWRYVCGKWEGDGDGLVDGAGWCECLLLDGVMVVGSCGIRDE
jgi:hypothetical protein